MENNKEHLNYQIVTSDDELEYVCQQARLAPYVALDTEFVRSSTYFPTLGLIQLYDGKQLALIDPLTIEQWQPFCQLLADRAVTKLLHACSEDLEIFLHEFGVLPTPMIDTQVLAAFNGYQLSTGFAKLVSDKLQVQLDKSESRTDWLVRPLTLKQCYYAAADVFYLLPLAHQLLKELNETQWINAALDECQQICQRRQQIVDPEKAYFDITNAWQLMPHQLAILQILAAWRLKYAREHNIALNFVVKEEHLRQVALAQPKTLYDLRQLGLTNTEIRHHGAMLLSLVKQGQVIEEAQFPKQIDRLIDYPNYKKAVKALKNVLQSLAAEKSINSELLASRRQINQLLRWHWQKINELPVLMSGWRGELFSCHIKEVLKEY